MHRDSQSQNVHIHAGKAWLIDFQGMRGGRPEYDLASLVYDGYARLEPEQAKELIREWEKISGQPLDDRIFRACALQRLMQMLGAYAKNLVSGPDSRRAGTPAEASARLHACRTAGGHASMIFLPAPDDADPQIPACAVPVPDFPGAGLDSGVRVSSAHHFLL